jgi:hypothetical protein
MAALMLLCAVNSNVGAGAAQRGDFSFRFEIGSCLPERFDTVTGVFTKDLGRGLTGTANITLSDAQMTEVYETIQKIRFFDYPSEFSDVVPELDPNVARVRKHPNNTYRLEVRSGRNVHSVTWNDGIKPVSAEGERLLDLFLMVRRIIHEHPSFRQIPASSYGCL